MFIVAEIGINHNGSLAIAKRLIDIAKDCGADAVKFQKRTIDLVYGEPFLDSPRESPWGATQRAQKEALELSADAYQEIDVHCRRRRLDWYASAWDLTSLRFLSRFHLTRNKVASAMIADICFLEAVAAERKPTFISTGKAALADLDRAVAIFRRAGCPFELMHCISAYPMPDEDANLGAISTLRERYGCGVGYSGHEVGCGVSMEAAALGITALERHITLDRSMYGSDQSASLEPSEFRSLVGAVRKTPQLEIDPTGPLSATKFPAA